MPTPSSKRPSSSIALVAAAWAMIAGWIRTVGQVTAVPTCKSVTAAMAPITLHTNGLWPCSSSHGWKWSEIHTRSMPDSFGEPCLVDESTRVRAPHWTGSSRSPWPVIPRHAGSKRRPRRGRAVDGARTGSTPTARRGCGARLAHHRHLHLVLVADVMAVIVVAEVEADLLCSGRQWLLGGDGVELEAEHVVGVRGASVIRILGGQTGWSSPGARPG